MGSTARDLVRCYVDEIINDKRIDPVDGLFQAGVTFRDPAAPGGVLHGVAGFKQFLAAVFAAFPDFRFTVDAVLGDGDQVGWRGIFRGTQQGGFAGLPAGGKQVEVPIAEFYQLKDGKIQDAWVFFDVMSFMQQLGAVPAPAG